MYILTITDNHEEKKTLYYHNKRNAIEKACSQYYLGEQNEYKADFLNKFENVDEEIIIDDGYVRLEILHTED